jgi:hypothetical protein
MLDHKKYTTSSLANVTARIQAKREKYASRTSIEPVEKVRKSLTSGKRGTSNKKIIHVNEQGDTKTLPLEKFSKKHKNLSKVKFLEERASGKSTSSKTKRLKGSKKPAHLKRRMSEVDIEPSAYSCVIRIGKSSECDSCRRGS